MSNGHLEARVTPSEVIELWFIKYWDLIRILTMSELRVKYQSSALGFIWSLLNPLLLMIVLFLMFSKGFKMTQDNYALYLLIGIVSWRFMASGTSASMRSISSRPSLVTKIRIPRQILVLSTVLACFINSVLEFLVLVPLLLIFGSGVSRYILLFPLIHILYFFIVYGLCLCLASLYVYYRDLDHIWEVVLQIGFFISPIIYPISIVPREYLRYYMLNPVTVVVQMYRDSLLYQMTPSLEGLLFVLLAGCAMVLIGSAVFTRLERRFAEEI